jgi:hypothetical protein
MTTIPTAAVITSIVDLLTEAYAGPPDPSSTWFIYPILPRSKTNHGSIQSTCGDSQVMLKVPMLN